MLDGRRERRVGLPSLGRLARDEVDDRRRQEQVEVRRISCGGRGVPRSVLVLHPPGDRSMSARSVRADKTTERTEVGRESSSVRQGGVLLRGPSHHALRERGGLQAAGFGKLKHVGVQPDRAMVGELEQKRVGSVAAIGRVLDGKVCAGVMSSEQKHTHASSRLVRLAKFRDVRLGHVGEPHDVVSAANDWRRRVGALRRIEETRHRVCAAWRRRKDGPVMAALDEFQEGDEECVVEQTVISPPPVNGVRVDLIGLYPTSTQKGRDAIRSCVRPREKDERPPRRVARRGEGVGGQRGQRVGRGGLTGRRRR